MLYALGQAGRETLDREETLARGHVGPSERRDAEAALDELIDAGTVVEATPGRYALAAKHHVRAGELEVHPDGYAFLASPEAEDLYISGPGLRPAMHGDRVLAAVERRPRGRFERIQGRVVRILARGTHRVLGVLRQGRSGAYLLPQDPRILYRVRLTETATARDGDMVVAVITRHPSAYEDIEAAVDTVLGPASDPRVETEAVIHAHGLAPEFPEDVRREAGEVPRTVTATPLVAGPPAPRTATWAAPADVTVAPVQTLPSPPPARRPWHDSPALATRIDLRPLPLVTIDGENARDFDDAVAVLERPDGGSRLLVAIADVAAYVPPGSALDREARARGTSVYFPDRVIPMLPEELSNGICSLVPDVDRLVQAVLLDLDRHGQTLGAAFFPGVIRSRARLTYTEVRQIVADQDLAVRRQHAELVDDLERMAALGEALAGMRQRRGSIDLDLPEAEIILDLRGRPENIVEAERNVAHRLIESFMLAANEAVAHYLTSQRVSLPYRVHEAPDEDALRDLARFLEGFGVRLALTEGKAEPRAFQRALAQIAGRPEQRLVHTVLLRAMKQARYAPANLGHFGLAAPCYTHFTSPIRRYPDLVLHRILAAHTAGDVRALAAGTAELAAVCDESSRRERVAMEAERDVVQLKKVQFMQERIGETFAGFVAGVKSFGMFVELAEYFVEGLVHVATLTDDRYDLDEHRHRLVGRYTARVFRVGDPVTVRVASVSIERKQIDLVLTDGERPPAAGRPRRTRHRRSGPR